MFITRDNKRTYLSRRERLRQQPDLCAEVCNVACRQQVIDVDQEFLLDNLIVRHEESDGDALHSSLHSPTRSFALSFWLQMKISCGSSSVQVHVNSQMEEGLKEASNCIITGTAHLLQQKQTH